MSKNPIPTGGERGSTITRDGKVHVKGKAKEKTKAKTKNSTKSAVKETLKQYRCPDCRNYEYNLLEDDKNCSTCNGDAVINRSNVPKGPFYIPTTKLPNGYRHAKQPYSPLPVFVYGILRSLETQHGQTPTKPSRYFPEDSKVLAAKLPNAFRIATSIISIGSGNGVYGEVVTIPKDKFYNTIQDLDIIETYNPLSSSQNNYDRLITNVETEDGLVEAYVYVPTF